MHSLKNTIVFERNQETLATLTLSATLFFDTLTVSDTLGDMLSQALNIVAPHATWYRADDMSRNQAMEEDLSARHVQLVKSALSSNTDCFLMLDSGNTLDGVGLWSLKYSNAPTYEGDVLGYVQVHVPYDETNSQHESLFRDVLAWVSGVNFLHGYVGLSMNFDHGDVDKVRNVAMRAYCERYLGVNLSDLITERRALHDSIKGAQWLTFVGNALLGQHEEEALRLRSAQGATSTPQGILIRACDKPLLGDRHQQQDVTPYINVSAQLAPWLVDNLFPMPGFPDEEATRAWLHRLRPDT